LVVYYESGSLFLGASFFSELGGVKLFKLLALSEPLLPVNR
jgi:hypothetical protein